jgi:signal transduction histidine kinase
MQLNLDRAVTLIGNFKQVAIDQTSENRRPFNLATVVGEIVTTVHPRFKHTPHRIELDIAHGIDLDSYPGPLGHVVMNLVLNSLIHGFTPEKSGTVTVAAAYSGSNRIRLKVTDDGAGIHAENLPRVFDPFFTTKLGQGGSGLGLSIAYNMVTGSLGGSIHVTSTPGNGTSFVIQIPVRAPQASSDTAAAMRAKK